MKIWEYCQIEISGDVPLKMNKYGKKGWELVGIWLNRAWFKREIKPRSYNRPIGMP